MESGIISVTGIIIIVVALVLEAILLRLIFKVVRNTNIQQAQLYLIMKMAEKQGVSREDLMSAAKIAENEVGVDFRDYYNHYSEHDGE